MNDDSTAEFLCTLTIPEEWVRRVNETPGESSKIKLVPYFDVWGGDAHFAVEMSDYQREMFTMLCRDFLDNDPLQTCRVLVAMAEKDVTHTN
jgi:hypothetical protein